MEQPDNNNTADMDSDESSTQSFNVVSGIPQAKSLSSKEDILLKVFSVSQRLFDNHQEDNRNENVENDAGPSTSGYTPFTSISIPPNTQINNQETGGQSRSLLLIAVKNNDEEKLKALIKRGYHVDNETDRKAPAVLAFEEKSYNLVYELVKANARFPAGCSNVLNGDLSDIYNKCSNLHESIKHNHDLKDIENKINEIQEKWPGLKYIYNAEGTSAVNTTVKFKSFKVFKILMNKGFLMSPYDIFKSNLDALETEEKSKYEEYLKKSFSPYLQDEMIALMQKCSLFGSDHPKYRSFIQTTFKNLFKIIPINLILLRASTQKELSIVFDFDNESIDHIVVVEKSPSGVVTKDHQIFIAAKGFDDRKKRREIRGNLAKLLCKYVMQLVYENNFLPFYNWQNDKEDFLNELYEIYRDHDMVKSGDKTELVPSVAYIIAKHKNNNFPQKRTVYLLFKFFDSNIIDMMHQKVEMTRKIVKFFRNRRVQLENAEKERKKYRNIYFAGCLILIILSLILFINPFENWKRNMIKFLQSNITNRSVLYKDVAVPFGTLFSKTSHVDDLIKMEYLDQKKIPDDNEVLDIQPFESLVCITWNEMPQNLKERFLISNVTFQGKNVMLNEITTVTTSTLSTLPCGQIKKIFDDKGMEIFKELDPDTTFSFERNFVEDIRRISNKNATILKSLNKVLSDLHITNDSKIFLLSDRAGEGKTAMLQQLWKRLKTDQPSKLVLYVELKKHGEFFRNNQNKELDSVVELTGKELNEIENILIIN